MPEFSYFGISVEQQTLVGPNCEIKLTMTAVNKMPKLFKPHLPPKIKKINGIPVMAEKSEKLIMFSYNLKEMLLLRWFAKTALAPWPLLAAWLPSKVQLTIEIPTGPRNSGITAIIKGENT